MVGGQALSRARRGTGLVRSRRERLVWLLAAVVLVATTTLFGPAAAAPAGTVSGSASGTASGSVSRTAVPASIPVFAYFYQWFSTSSWRRAKHDFPLAGHYSSDDPHVLRDQIVQAQSAGVDGFLTSWKSTPTLNRRLTLLLSIAHERRLDVGVVYEALDFQRNPLPVATVRADMLTLVGHWGTQLRSSYYGRPVIIWTGTDRYSVADVSSVRAALGSRAYLLAASKSASGYSRIAAHVDGEAYYWSSSNPQAPSTVKKLQQMGSAVHAHHGIWIAPAASGFDGTTLGHTRVIDRRNGATLVHSLDDAYASKPDGIGVISWNEWSENTYIEPGEKYGSQEIKALRGYLSRGQSVATSPAPTPVTALAQHSWSGLRAVVLLTVVTVLGILLLFWRVTRAGRRAARHAISSSEPPRSVPAQRVRPGQHAAP